MSTSVNLYHPLSLESPSEENTSSSPNNSPNTSASAVTTPSITVENSAPLYFETAEEPIYSHAFTPHIKRKHEPLYHETVPDDLSKPPQRKPPAPPTSTLTSPSTISASAKDNRLDSNSKRKSITPPHTLSRRKEETPPPVPNTRRPSGAIFTPVPSPTSSVINLIPGYETENTKV